MKKQSFIQLFTIIKYIVTAVLGALAGSQM